MIILSLNRRHVLKCESQDFPVGVVDENLPANAWDMGSIPDLESIPRAAEQTKPCAPVITTESELLEAGQLKFQAWVLPPLKPRCLEPVLQQEKPPQ